MSNVENITTVTTTKPEAGPTVADATITVDVYNQMLDILNDLVNHTHIFYDDYTSVCNCNCNCNCTRGSL